MSLYKLSPSWAKAEADSSAFLSAWGTLLNGLSGTWGTISYQMIFGVDSTASISQGRFISSIDTEVEGSTEITLPWSISGIGYIDVQVVESGTVSSTTRYVVEDGKQKKTITLPEGRKIISVSGVARRP